MKSLWIKERETTSTKMAAGVRVMLRRLLQSSPTMYSVGDEEENSTVIIPTSPKSFMTIEKSCDHIDTNYNIALSIICAMSFIFGIIYTFFGEYIYISVIIYTFFGEYVSVYINHSITDMNIYYVTVKKKLARILNAERFCYMGKYFGLYFWTYPFHFWYSNVNLLTCSKDM